MTKKQQAKHRHLYDQRYRGAELDVGDLVLVKQTAKIDGRVRNTRCLASLPLVSLCTL